MLLKMSKLSIAALALISASSMASTTITADFGSVSDGGLTFNQFSVVSGGITVDVSGWSDTDESNSDGISSNGTDDNIFRARDLDKYNGGWALENRDEKNADGTNTGYGGNEHTADNTTGGTQDYDFFLLEFSQEVNLSSATSSFLLGQGGSTSSRDTAANNNQITVAALTDNTLLNNNWANIEATQTDQSGFAGFTYSATAGYYTSDLTTSDANVAGVYSNTWLIGALNSIFGGNASDEGDDGFKLASVSFSTDSGTPPPATTVPEPTSIMMFGLALVGFATSRRKSK
jgi:hypothetical protein